MDASDWDQRYAAADLVWSSAPNLWVEQLLGERVPGRALDVAAGEGRNAIWLAERGWLVTAADFSPVAVSRLREIAADRLGEHEGALTAVVADAMDPAPPPAAASDGSAAGGEGTAYDVVLFCYLHLPAAQWRRAIAAGVAATAPGGTVVVVAHARRNLAEGVGGPQDPSILLDPGHVVDSVDGLPVDVESARIGERVVEGSDRPALDTVVVLRRHAG